MLDHFKQYNKEVLEASITAHEQAATAHDKAAIANKRKVKLQDPSAASQATKLAITASRKAGIDPDTARKRFTGSPAAHQRDAELHRQLAANRQ